MSDSILEERSMQKLRQRAEAVIDLKPESRADLNTLSSEQIRRLVHELDVYRVELEMQNEELRRAQEEMQESRESYAVLYDFAPVGHFTLDRKGIIRRVNLTGARLLGLEPKFLVNSPFTLFVATESRNAFHGHLQRVFDDSGRTNARDRYVAYHRHDKAPGDAADSDRGFGFGVCGRLGRYCSGHIIGSGPH